MMYKKNYWILASHTPSCNEKFNLQNEKITTVINSNMYFPNMYLKSVLYKVLHSEKAITCNTYDLPFIF